MSTKMLLSTLIILSAFSSCKKNDNPPGEKEYRIQASITVDGLVRTYTLNLPPNYYESDNFSLIIAMHGGGGSGEQFESTSLLTQKANASGFIVVYPDGVKSDGLLQARTWNAGGCCDYAVAKNINDVGFIRQLISKLTSSYKIDPKKVYATGHSNGGMLSYRLACEVADKIAAIAVSGCSMMVTQPCNASRAVPILHMHSEKDTNVPVNGGYGTGPSNAYYHPLDSVFNVWSQKNVCTIPNQVVTTTAKYTLRKWSGCNNSTTIEYYLTKDGGHAWPGGLPGSVIGDTPSTAISANDLLWEFFQRYKLP
ncbi:MAG: dienelactone hydrolase family protein [Chitinophagaceae bacterium]|nr:dienelactone hydrolase family protein [Chitinophagaceae bacterium]